MRARVTFTIETDIINQLREASRITLIPQSRLVERAISAELKRMADTGTALVDPELPGIVKPAPAEPDPSDAPQSATNK